MKKKRILIVGHAVEPTGYARVIHSIFRYINDSFEIVHFGINYKGSLIEREWIIEPNRIIGDVMGEDQLPAILEKYQPDILFMCHDPWLFSIYKDTLAHFSQDLKIVLYCPIEYPNQELDNILDFLRIDKLVMYTNFGRNVIETAFRKKGYDLNNLLRPSISILPHGVDTDKFYPLSYPSSQRNLNKNRIEARKRLFPDRPELESAFIVLNANRNCQRKRIDITLQAFAEFARYKHDAFLYLHMGMIDRGIDIISYAKQLGIENNILTTTNSCEKPSISDDILNLIYNASDVGINTSSGEGWGLVAFEHAATCAAQIMPEHSACEELWKDSGIIIPLTKVPAIEMPSIMISEVSIAGVSQALNRLYHERAYLFDASLNAYKFAAQPKFQWKNIAACWETIFNQL